MIKSIFFNKTLIIVLGYIIISCGGDNSSSETNTDSSNNENTASSNSYEWIRIKGNNANTGVSESKINFDFPTLKWKYYVGSGSLFTSPIVKDNSVIACGSDNNIYSIDIDSGKLNWKFQMGGNQIRSTPAIYNETIFIGGLDTYFYAIDFKTGIEKWKFKTEDELSKSPIIENNIAIINAYGKLYAIDVNTQQEKWTSTSNSMFGYSSSDFSPAISNNTVFVSGEYKVYAFDLKSGEKKWEYVEESSSDRSSPVHINGIVILGSDHYLFALDENTGEEKWKVNFGMNAFFHGSPSIFNDLLVARAFSSEKSSHFIIAVNINTLEKIWEFETNQDEESSVTIADNTVFFGSDDGYLYALDLFTGLQKWGYKTDGYVSNPAVANGRIFISSNDGYVYALE